MNKKGNYKKAGIGGMMHKIQLNVDVGLKTVRCFGEFT